jgi:hypothetical protein
MSKIGVAVANALHGSHANYFDVLCDNMVWQNVTNVNSATNLAATEAGTIILGVVGTQQALSTGFNVNLPTPQRGLWYNFVLGAPSIANNSNAAITVTATSDGSTAADIALGMVEGTGNDEGANVVAGVDILTFVHNKATAGDHATYICDGTNWFCVVKYDADGAITLA